MRGCVHGWISNTSSKTIRRRSSIKIKYATKRPTVSRKSKDPIILALLWSERQAHLLVAILAVA